MTQWSREVSVREGGAYLVIIRPWKSIPAFDIPTSGVDGMQHD